MLWKQLSFSSSLQASATFSVCFQSIAYVKKKFDICVILGGVISYRRIKLYLLDHLDFYELFHSVHQKRDTKDFEALEQPDNLDQEQESIISIQACINEKHDRKPRY